MLRVTPIHRALYRPPLLLGAERELSMTLIFAVASLVFLVQTFLSVAVGGVLYVAGQMLLRRMAQEDPELSKVYMRSLQYRERYCARSRPQRTAGNAAA